jgi:uncharacterized protein YdeI (YjbR/CyaY-like superfamily)
MSRRRDPRVGGYIKKSAAFARPILDHLRDLVHGACPEVEEDMKWSMPFFVHRGRNLCHMAAFKAHCAFGFWHRGMRQVLTVDRAKADEAMGSFGRITSLADLPGDRILTGYIRRAAALNESDVPGQPRRPTVKKKAGLPVPVDLAAVLRKHKTAATTFAKFSPSHRREYIEWITEAKRDGTRRKRLATTVEWLAEGKPRHWKYVTR